MADEGVVFPAGPDGRRSTAALGRSVVADALRPVDPVGAGAAERETNWRAGYLPHFRRLVEAGLVSREAALTIAVPVAVIGEFLSVIMRMVIAQFSHVADKAIENGQFKKAIHIHLWWSFGFNSLVYFIPIFLTVYFGTDLVSNLVAAIPEVITNGLTVAGNLLSALGFAMLLSSMLSKKMFPYFLLGFLIVAYSGLSLIGVTMFAAILAFILDKVLYGKGANA